METSEKIDLLSAALVKAQSQIGKAYKSSSNPFFKSKYVPLDGVIDTVVGPLTENGISFLQSPGRDEFGMYLETRLQHESGQWISGKTPIFCAKQNDIQAMGSAITYGKRYGLQAICGMATTDEDDDGERTMDRVKDSVINEVKKMLITSGKTHEQIERIVKWAAEDDSVTKLSDLSGDQLKKVKAVLEKRV